MTLKKVFEDFGDELELGIINKTFRGSRDLQSSNQTEIKQEAQIEVPPKR